MSHFVHTAIPNTVYSRKMNNSLNHTHKDDTTMMKEPPVPANLLFWFIKLMS